MPTRHSISPSRSPSPRPRSRSRSYSRPRSVSPRHSPAPRARSRSRTPRSPLRSPTPRARSISPRHNGHRERGRPQSRSGSRSPSRSPYSSRAPSRDRQERRYRDRSYTRSPSPPRRSTKIVIEKLTKNVNEGHLREIFGTYGDIQSLDLPMNRQFMTNRGSAYICYYDAADAESAIAHMHEAQLDGAVLSVSIVLPRRTFDRTPPPARMPARPEPWRSGYSATGPGRPPSTRYRSPPPPRRQFRAPQTMNRHDIYRPRSVSRSRSRSRTPPGRSPSYSSRSPSPQRRRDRRDSYGSVRRRRRGSSYGSRSRSRSPRRPRYSRR